MAELFEIPVTYKGKDVAFKAHSNRLGYVNHILVDIYGTYVTIERDEEGKFRALINPEMREVGNLDLELVQAIVEVLSSL